MAAGKELDGKLTGEKGGGREPRGAGKALGIIPARWGSSRFPGKPLAKIGGISLIGRVIRGVQTSSHLQEILVATDDRRIFEEAQSHGARAEMTDPHYPSGTDRVWAVAKNLEAQWIVNIQGDEPLIQASLIDQLLEPLFQDGDLDMATLGCELGPGDLESPDSAKVVLNSRAEAIYFSRLPIPFTRCGYREGSSYSQVRKHVGIYGFQRFFLEKFVKAGPCELEQMEGLEQLRALHLGGRIRVVTVDCHCQGVDRPEDVQKIEALLKGANYDSP